MLRNMRETVEDETTKPLRKLYKELGNLHFHLILLT